MGVVVVIRWLKPRTLQVTAKNHGNKARGIKKMGGPRQKWVNHPDYWVNHQEYARGNLAINRIDLIGNRWKWMFVSSWYIRSELDDCVNNNWNFELDSGICKQFVFGSLYHHISSPSTIMKMTATSVVKPVINLSRDRISHQGGEQKHLCTSN